MSDAPTAASARRSSAGIVLAGGRASRFGADKLAIVIDGRPLLLHAIDAVAAVCSEVIVVTAAGSDAAGPLDVGAQPVPLRWTRDQVADRGPLAGLLAGLEKTTAATVIVVGGDMPSLVPAVLALLLDRLGAGVEAAALADGDSLRPLPAALTRTAALAAATTLTPDRPGLRDLLARLRTELVPEAEWRLVDPTGASLLDVDRPADLARLDVAPTR